MPSDVPRTPIDPVPIDPRPIGAPATHPNLPRRGALAVMFSAIVVCGTLGGAIGYGLVRTSCPSTPTVAERLVEIVPGYHAHQPSCALKLLGGALTGTALAAIGAGVVAMLMLRAQSEWRAHPAGRPPPIRRSQSGEMPPRT